MKALSKIGVLVLDDWGLVQLSAGHQRDLLELLDGRHGRKLTIVASQSPPQHWHEVMADPTLADALLDRLIHSAYHLQLKGEPMRKRLSDVPQAIHLPINQTSTQALSRSERLASEPVDGINGIHRQIRGGRDGTMAAVNKSPEYKYGRQKFPGLLILKIFNRSLI